MLIVLRNSEKLEFYKSIDFTVPFPFEHFKIDKEVEKMREKSRQNIFATEKNERYKKEEFFTPIHYYTCNRFYGAINAFLRNIKYESQYIFRKNEIKFITHLIKSLNELPNYINTVHRGINKLRFSLYQKAGDCFYWKSFTSTSKKVSVA